MECGDRETEAEQERADQTLQTLEPISEISSSRPPRERERKPRKRTMHLEFGTVGLDAVANLVHDPQSRSRPARAVRIVRLPREE